MILPFESQGVAMAPAEETMLEPDDGWISSLLGKGGLLFLVNLLFWVMWVNILLGFTNLIPMVPFDGGHMFKDMVHAGLTRFRAVGRKLKQYLIIIYSVCTLVYNFHSIFLEFNSG
jgi:membrane-associated protease RseP (regulator of RpoE activity)